jgi:hypothetical protein
LVTVLDGLVTGGDDVPLPRLRRVSAPSRYHQPSCPFSIGWDANDLQRNWRVGATVASPLGTRQSIKLYASRGVSARTGNNVNLIGIALHYR